MESPGEVLKMHTLVKVIDVEPNLEYPGKYIATLHIDGVTFSSGWRYYVSEKQMKALQRVHHKVPVQCVLKHIPGKGTRFVFASDNAAWLKEAFIDNPRPSTYVAKPKQEPQTPIDEDLPF